MRVLHINRNYLGTTLHQSMIEHLDSLGVCNKVFVPVSKTEESVVNPNKNVCVAKCLNSVDRYFFDLKQFKIIRSIEKNIDVKSYDVIHAYTLFTDGNAAMKLAAKYHKPYVVAVRDTDVNVFFAKIFYLRRRGVKILKNAKKIFFLSDTYRKQVFEKYVPKHLHGELMKKTMVVPNGIDDFWHNNLWNCQKKINNPLKLIFAGQISRRKNVSAIKKAMDVLENKGIKTNLTIVGKIVDQIEFEKVKNDERIVYLPALPKERLIEQYRNHDLFVMPSLTETFGLVYAEALTQGLPVVYSQGQGFDGQFEEGYVGYHCDAYDANDIAEAVEKVLMNYDEISAHCVGAALKFTWSGICSNYKAVYELI